MKRPITDDNRYEIKFILNQAALTEAMFFLKMIGTHEMYPERQVNSIYYDTPDFESVRDNLSGVSDRNKLRLRWYGRKHIPSYNNMVMEIKNRYGRVGRKKKYFIDDLSNTSIHTSTVGELNSNIAKYLWQTYEYNGLINSCNIPVLYVGYTRSYYEEKSDIRITIDKKIHFRNVTLNKYVLDHSKLPYNQNIMEIKFPLDMKNKVVDLLRPYNFTPMRHSKYLVGLAKLGYSVYI